MNGDDFKGIANNAIDINKDSLKDLSSAIWENPELCFQEHKAVKNLTTYLEEKGFKVTRQYCGLETAFKAEVSNGEGGIHVCVICEYDALPGIGHACGHNLIAEAGVAAGIGLQAVLKAGLVGHVTVMGTPAEEGGGGKIILVERSAFQDIDLALMVHPAPFTSIYNEYLAITNVRITYKGKPSHAAGFPWEGLNALDAAVMAYNSVSVARQQFKPTWRVHGIIVKGGVQPNIIPETSILDYYIRAPTVQELQVLKKKMYTCFEAAAQATGCTVNIQKVERDYDNVLTNPILANLFEANLRAEGVTDIKGPCPAGSTDMGNVTHVVPGLHPKYAVGSGEVNHSIGFTTVTNTVEAHSQTLVMGKAMAHTCIDVMISNELMKQIKDKFDEEKDSK